MDVFDMEGKIEERFFKRIFDAEIEALVCTCISRAYIHIYICLLGQIDFGNKHSAKQRVKGIIQQSHSVSVYPVA